jgi:16S rRNA G966 N2-methylase RsmD
MYAFIAKNAAMLGMLDLTLLKMDVFSFLASCTNSYDFIFAGPPYALGTIDELPKKIIGQQLIAPGGFFVLEHTPRNAYEKFEGFSFVRNYGTTVFSFFTNEN